MYVEIEDTLKTTILNQLEQHVNDNINTLSVKYEILTSEPASTYSFMFKNQRCIFTKDGVFIGEELFFVPTDDTRIFETLKDLSRRQLDKSLAKEHEKLRKLFS